MLLAGDDIERFRQRSDQECDAIGCFLEHRPPRRDYIEELFGGCGAAARPEPSPAAACENYDREFGLASRNGGRWHLGGIKHDAQAYLARCRLSMRLSLYLPHPCHHAG